MSSSPRVSNNKFQGKVAIITGATSGIGKEAAIQLAALGVKVVVSGRRRAEGEAVVATIRAAAGIAEFFQLDVANEKEVTAVVDFAVSTFGRLDFAVNNAGVEFTKELVSVEEADYRRVFDVNVWGVLAGLKHEIPAILKTAGTGAIVNISSIAGVGGMPANSVYVASKHAVEGLTKTAALEYAKQGIRINNLSPAGVRTEMFDRFIGSEEQEAWFQSMHPVGRIGTVGEVTKAILFLLDPDNSFMTGATLMVDGGWTAKA